MPKYEKSDETVREIADEIIAKYHHELRDRNVKIDLVTVWPDFDEVTGEPINDALKKNGCKALGITRKLPPKDRAMGRGDAEVSLDGVWWEKASLSEQRALMDHELHHLIVSVENDKDGRPKLKMRPHDFEFGWFAIVAQRHGHASQERQQAKHMMDKAGQYFWPLMEQTPLGTSRMQSVELGAV